MRKRVLGLSSTDEKKAVKAFADHNKEGALKTKPKVCAKASLRSLPQTLLVRQWSFELLYACALLVLVSGVAYLLCW